MENVNIDNTESIEVVLTAFKRSGKYYGDYTITCSPRKIYNEDGRFCSYRMDDIFDAVKLAIKNGVIPSEFIYCVDIEDGYSGLVNM